MGTLFLTDIAGVLREAGLTVIEIPGWQTRARGSGGYDANTGPEGISVHHTAENPLMDGQTSAVYGAINHPSKPISNCYVSRKGVWYVQAAGASNTSGKGGPYHGIPLDAANARTIGVECGNNGVGEAWPDEQVYSILHGVAALYAYCARRFGWGIELGRVYAHFEWAPGRKIDPRGPSLYTHGLNNMWDMNGFRADIAMIVFPRPEDPPPPPPPSVEVTPPPVVTPIPDPPPTTSNDSVAAIPTGFWRIKAGDTPWHVASVAYGGGGQYPKLQAANPDPVAWKVGGMIWAPDRSGHSVKVEPGNGWYSLLSRCGKIQSPTNLAVIQEWNGGSGRVLRPGELVFVPD